MKKTANVFLILLLGLSGCASQMATETLTLGTVQQSLYEGMTQAEIQAALGAPNIISRDAEGLEVWTYDKVSKESTSQFMFFWTASSSKQRTLTVLITFNEEGRLREYTYHSMEF
jgi:outer membrane protein assembly factor BamE (lipoprotein component of BamABCDE complex)